MSKKEPSPIEPEKGLDELENNQNSYSTMHIELPAHILDKVDTAKKTVRIAGRKKLNVTAKKKHPLPQSLSDSPLQETAFQNLLQNVYDGVFIIDLEGDILEVNERAAYLLSSEGTELTNRSLFDIIPGTDESLIGTITDNLKADRFTLINAWCLKDDGSQFPVEISANWLELEENKYLNLFMRDISRRVENEEKLESFAQELKAKNEELENDLIMARELQQAFVLTDFPSHPEAATPAESQVQFGRIYIPSGAVGGDYIDIRRIDEHKIGVFMGDVSGHGLRAALIVSYLRGLFEQLSGSADNPGEFITNLNKNFTSVFQIQDRFMFVSCFYCVLDFDKKQIQYANAGHPTPYILHRQIREVEPITKHAGIHGPAVGLMPDSLYETGSCPMVDDDVLFLYTDGIYEAHDADNVEYGFERLTESLIRHAALPPDDLLLAMLDDVKRFSHRSEFEDDVCMLSVEFKSNNV